MAFQRMIFGILTLFFALGFFIPVTGASSVVPASDIDSYPARAFTLTLTGTGTERWDTSLSDENVVVTFDHLYRPDSITLREYLTVYFRKNGIWDSRDFPNVVCYGYEKCYIQSYIQKTPDDILVNFLRYDLDTFHYYRWKLSDPNTYLVITRSQYIAGNESPGVRIWDTASPRKYADSLWDVALEFDTNRDLMAKDTRSAPETDVRIFDGNKNVLGYGHTSFPAPTHSYVIVTSHDSALNYMGWSSTFRILQSPRHNAINNRTWTMPVSADFNGHNDWGKIATQSATILQHHNSARTATRSWTNSVTVSENEKIIGRAGSATPEPQSGGTIANVVYGVASSNRDVDVFFSDTRTSTTTSADALIIARTSSDIPQVIANFTASPRSGNAPLAVSFTDLSLNNPTGWAWIFGDSPGSKVWMQMNASSGWAERWFHSSVAMPDGSIILTGGYDSNNCVRNDTWRSTDNGSTWILMNGSSGWSARWGHGTVALPDNSIVMLGGEDNDTWRSIDNGATWTRMNASPGWSARNCYGSVALPDGSIILMGGIDDYSRNDTWQSTDNGATWTRMSASPGWSARNRFSSVALPDGSIVLTGGLSGGSLKNDTWRSTDNGATWTRMNASSGWSARYGHTSAALQDGSILLMGGTDNILGKKDVWQSVDKGATWTRLPDAGWTERMHHSSAVMPDGSIILMGGPDALTNHLTNETWRFMPAGSSEQNPVHTYTSPGTYRVVLQAYNDVSANRTERIGYITVKSITSPIVSGITPPAGIRSRLVTITNLSGANFLTGAQVYLNRTGYPLIPATNVTVVNARNITCTIKIPAAAPLGLRNVDVRNSNGNRGSRVNAFMVMAPAAPVISTLQPNTGRRGTLVTITNLSGAGFIGTPNPVVQLSRGSSVITGTNVTVVSTRTITCTFRIPATTAAGAWNASVTNGDNQKGVRVSAFRITL